MNDENKENETFFFEPEDVYRIIDWAIGTAAMVLALGDMPRERTTEESLKRLNSFEIAAGYMWQNLPDVLVEPARQMAEACLTSALDEEEQVQKFLDELKDL